MYVEYMYVPSLYTTLNGCTVTVVRTQTVHFAVVVPQAITLTTIFHP